MKTDEKLNKINSDIQGQQQMVEGSQQKLLQQTVRISEYSFITLSMFIY